MEATTSNGRSSVESSRRASSIAATPTRQSKALPNITRFFSSQVKRVAGTTGSPMPTRKFSTASCLEVAPTSMVISGVAWEASLGLAHEVRAA